MMIDLPGSQARKFVYLCLRSLFTPIIRASIQIEVIGQDHIPSTGPAILVCNHRSDIDPSILGAVIPRYIAWMAAAYMKQVPFKGWLIEAMGMVFVDVNGKVLPSSIRQALRVLEQGDLLGVFPEGGEYIFANDFSAGLAPFYPGFAMLALRQQVPILPVVICPLEEKYKPIRIPPSIRAEIARTHDLNILRTIPQYKRVQVVLGAPIQPRRIEGSTREEQIKALISQVRGVMLALQERHWRQRSGAEA